MNMLAHLERNIKTNRKRMGQKCRILRIKVKILIGLSLLFLQPMYMQNNGPKYYKIHYSFDGGTFTFFT